MHLSLLTDYAFMYPWGNKQVRLVDQVHKVHSPILLCYKISQWYCEENAAEKATSDEEGALPTSPPIHHTFLRQIIKVL